MYQENVTPKKKKKKMGTHTCICSFSSGSDQQPTATRDSWRCFRASCRWDRDPSRPRPTEAPAPAQGRPQAIERDEAAAEPGATPPLRRPGRTWPEAASGRRRARGGREAGPGEARAARRGAAGAAQSPAPLGGGGGGRKAEGGSAMPGPAAPGPGPDPEESYDFLFKLVLIGDASVGKTCLVQRFKTGAFAERQGSTIGVDFTMKSLEIQGKRVKVSGGAEGRPPPRAAARQGELRSARRGPRLPRGCPARCRLPHPAAYLSIPAVLLCSEEGLRGSGASFPNGPGEGAEPSLHINLLATVGPAV